MSGDYFVMLTTQSGGYTPLLDDKDELGKFETEDAAIAGALSTILGELFGFEVFERGRGEASG